MASQTWWKKFHSKLQSLYRNPKCRSCAMLSNLLFFIFMCKYKIILQNLQVFSWELSNSRKDETAAKCILIIQLHNNQWSCIPEKIQIFVVICSSPCKEMYNFKRVGMKIIYRITDTMIHRKKIRNIQLGFEFDRN